MKFEESVWLHECESHNLKLQAWLNNESSRISLWYSLMV